MCVFVCVFVCVSRVLIHASEQFFLCYVLGVVALFLSKPEIVTGVGL